MPITDRDRKLLWARAGGTCTICKCHLTVDAKIEDRDVVLGEEAHIVSPQQNGPRFRPMLKNEVDSYYNLLLLCPPDHKIIDEQVNHYTEQRLHSMKREHEQWVKERIAPTAPTIRIRDPQAGKPIMLQRIDTGKELMSVVGHVRATHRDNPEPQSAEEADLIGEFFQNITDYIDIWDDLESSGRIQAEFTLSKEINHLRKAGFVIYAGARNHIIEGGIMPPASWPVAWLIMYRNDDEAIKTKTAP